MGRFFIMLEKKLMIFILFSTFITLCLPLLSLAAPVVYITDVKVDGQAIDVGGSESATVDAGDTFWISVTIENQGDDWSGHGQGIIWIENYSNVESVDDNNFDTHVVFPEGSTKYIKTGGTVTTSCVSVEADVNGRLELSHFGS